jgi:mono/diheme cytochrome c family protein
MKTKYSLLVILCVGVFVSFSFVAEISDQDPWPVPDKYQKMKNPYKADKESISIGKSLYVKHCKSCHGKEGLGDGPKAAQLDTPSGDFTADEFVSQSSGALFYKTFEGRDDMPSFKKKIPDAEDIWSIINYIRTFE